MLSTFVFLSFVSGTNQRAVSLRSVPGVPLPSADPTSDSSASSSLTRQVRPWVVSGARATARVVSIRRRPACASLAPGLSQNHVSQAPVGNWRGGWEGGGVSSQRRILQRDHSPAADKSLNQWLCAREQPVSLTLPRATWGLFASRKVASRRARELKVM